MQVQVTIEPGQMGETIVEMFNSLTSEQRMVIMKDIMREWFATPVRFEQAAMYEALIREIRAGKHNDAISWSDRDNVRNWTDDQIRAAYWFKTLAEKICVNSREIMVAEAIKEAKAVFADEIKDLVKTDPDLNTAKNIVMEELKKAYPAMMHDALLVYFSSFMQQTAQNVAQNSMQTQYIGTVMQNIQQRMQQIGQ